MTTLTVIDVASGDPVDRITLDDDELEYDTGVARDMFESLEAVGLTPAQAFDARNGWSNGYLRITAEAITAAFRYDPGQHRNPDGKWGDGVPGAPALSRKADPLGLSGRVRLESGETLRGSDRVRTNSGGDGDTLLAAVSGPDGPQVRFAVLPSADARSWAAGDKGATARFEGAEDARRVASELTAVSDEAKRSRENLRATSTQLERENVWEVDDADLTPDQIARRAAYELLGDDTTISSGVIPGSDWGDIHWAVQGSNIGDPGEEEALVSVVVRPQDERDVPWDEMRDSVTGSWFPALYDVSGASRLARSAAKMADAAQTAVTAAFRFDPGQLRDRDGQWTSSGMGGVGVLSDFDAWSEQSADPGGVTGDDLLRIGADIGAIMSRDGTSMADPVALFRATTEAVAADDADITARQYVRAMDRDYGTNLDRAITDALAAPGVESVVEQPQAAPTPAPSSPEPDRTGPPEWSPDFGASIDDRRNKLQQGIDSGIVDADNLAGGDVAETVRLDWKDGSRSVLKTARRTVRHGITPKDQTDAEELAGLVGNAIGVRAPVAQRVGENEIYLEYMPGQSAMQRFRGASTYHLTKSEQGLNVGLLDHLIGNADRHDGNWTVDDDNNIYAIDHGLAFTEQDTGMTFGPFAFQLFYGGHKVPRARLDEVRSQIEGLRPEFKRLRRREWYEQMIGRLDDLQSRIGGE